MEGVRGEEAGPPEVSTISKLTIRRIAELAGVAKSTVSKVLNNQPDVGPETRKRILELVESLDYVPDASARAVATGRTGTLGIIIPRKPGPVIQGQYWSSVVGEVAMFAARRNHDLLILTPRSEGEVVSAYRTVLRTRKVDGLIIGSEVLHEHDVDPLLQAGIPFVLIGENPWVPHYAVTTDNRGGARAMTSLLIERGYRRIGILTGATDFPYVRERIEGWKEALAASGLPEGPIASERGTEEEICAGVESLLKAGADAVFVAAGAEAMITTLARMRELGKSDGVGLGVFDDDPVLDLITPSVPAVVQPLANLADSAVSLLLQLIEGTTPEPMVVTLPTSLKLRS
jgi:DNA-binding LacI/PurR family transcriptional regulator